MVRRRAPVVTDARRRRRVLAGGRPACQRRPVTGSHPFVLADVFTDRPLAGNQLAVFLEGGAVPAASYQAIAREMNLSETVFVLPPATGGDAAVRIFTPGVELRFAGHPALGTAFVLAERSGADEVVLETGNGPVPVRFEGGVGRMVQPVPEVTPFADADALLAALGVARSVLPVEVYDNGVRHVFVALGSAEEVAAVRPDLPALARLLGVQGANCFGPDGEGWRTRMFLPAGGIDEDPATGSAAGSLAVHLARHGRVPFGEEVTIVQGAEVGRPSTLLARADGDAGAVRRVEVGGSTVVVGEGRLLLP